MGRANVWKWGLRLFETAQGDGCIETDDRLILKNRPQWWVWKRLQVWPRTERNSNPGLPHFESDALTTRLRYLLNRRKLACARASSLFRGGPRDNARASGPLELASPFACDSCVTSRDSPKRRACLQAKEIWALFLSPPRNNKYNKQHHKNMKISLFKFTKKIYRSG